MVSTIAVEIVRVDKDTLKLLKYPLHVWPGTHEAMLKQVERGYAMGALLTHISDSYIQFHFSSLIIPNLYLR